MKPLDGGKRRIYQAPAAKEAACTSVTLKKGAKVSLTKAIPGLRRGEWRVEALGQPADGRTYHHLVPAVRQILNQTVAQA